MEIFQKIKDYSKKERNVIIKKQIRPFFLLALVGYMIVVASLVLIDDYIMEGGIVARILAVPLSFPLSLPMFDGIRELFFEVPVEDFTFLHWAITLVALTIVLVYATVLIIVLVVIPCLAFLTRYERVLDKIYLDDEESTVRWREKYGNPEDYILLQNTELMTK